MSADHVLKSCAACGERAGEKASFSEPEGQVAQECVSSNYNVEHLSTSLALLSPTYELKLPSHPRLCPHFLLKGHRLSETTIGICCPISHGKQSDIPRVMEMGHHLESQSAC